jgi:hypothetical protein
MYAYPGFGAPGMVALGPDMGSNIPPVPLDLPKQLFRYGEQTIWSSQFFAGGAALVNTTSRLFSTQQGQVGQGFALALSIAETNLKESGRVPSGVAYDVFGVACQFLQGGAGVDGATLATPVDNDVTITNLLNVINNGVLTWDFTQTQVDIAPIVLIGAGGGAYGALAGPAAAVEFGNMNNGNGSVWLYRKHPVALPGSSTFAVLLRIGNRAPVVGANFIVVKVILLGYYKNAIEIG